MLRMVPTHERLGVHDALALHVDLRLEVELQLVARDRLAQLHHQRQSPQRVLVASRLVDRDAAVIPLRVVHRDVRVIHQRPRVVGVRRIQRDAEAGVDVDGDVAEDERRIERRLMRAATSRRHACSVGAVNMTANSSPPRRATVSLSRSVLLEAAADLDQQLIAEVMAERVVDLLEAIDVHHDHADRGAAASLRAGDGVRQRGREERAIRQPGQRVVRRLKRIWSSRAAIADCI